LIIHNQQQQYQDNTRARLAITLKDRTHQTNISRSEMLPSISFQVS